MTDFLQEFDQTYAPRLEAWQRKSGFRKLFWEMHRLSIDLGRPLQIVETGCSRNMDGWASDGMSTYLFSRFAGLNPGTRLTSFDLNSDAAAVGRAICELPGHCGDVQCRDAIAGLWEFGSPIDVLHLDSYDVDFSAHEPSAKHHLKEFTAALRWLAPQSIVFVDDNIDGRGKGTYVHEFLVNVGAVLLHDEYQVMYRLSK